jgi:hypothetical protein
MKSSHPKNKSTTSIKIAATTTLSLGAKLKARGIEMKDFYQEKQ